MVEEDAHGEAGKGAGEVCDSPEVEKWVLTKKAFRGIPSFVSLHIRY